MSVFKKLFVHYNYLLHIKETFDVYHQNGQRVLTKNQHVFKENNGKGGKENKIENYIFFSGSKKFHCSNWRKLLQTKLGYISSARF